MTPSPQLRENLKDEVAVRYPEENFAEKRFMDDKEQWQVLVNTIMKPLIS
jgi:hypothetical protein